MMDEIREFMKLSYLQLTINASLNASLQRSNVYEKGRATMSERREFRKAFRQHIKTLSNQYKKSISDDAHFENIGKLASEMSKQFKGILKEGRLRIGVAQKALNVYLKYLWCIGCIPEPPHCPFDFYIIGRFPRKLRKAWTKIVTLEEYREIVDVARSIAGEQSLAQWELVEYLRRIGAISA